MKARLTLRIGAAYDEVVIQGHTFDRSALSRRQRDAMASLIIDNLFPASQRKHRRSKAHGAKRRVRSARQRSA